MGTILRIGDIEGRPEEACEIIVKTSKCTALARPKGWKKFGERATEGDDDEYEDMEKDMEKEKEKEKEKEGKKVAYVQLATRTEYYVDRTEDEEDEDKGDSKKMKSEDDMDVDVDNRNESVDPKSKETVEKVEKEQLVRGFKYGSTYAPCPDGQFPKLETRKGIDICGFFYTKNVCPSPSRVGFPS